MKQHKWHKEIVAWAAGAEIEYRYFDNLEREYTEWTHDKFPNWGDTEFEFRIKPTPKEPQYLYVYAKLGWTQIELHRDYKEGENAELHRREYIGKIKLENDDAN